MPKPNNIDDKFIDYFFQGVDTGDIEIIEDCSVHIDRLIKENEGDTLREILKHLDGYDLCTYQTGYSSDAASFITRIKERLQWWKFKDEFYYE